MKQPAADSSTWAVTFRRSSFRLDRHQLPAQFPVAFASRDDRLLACCRYLPVVQHGRNAACLLGSVSNDLLCCQLVEASIRACRIQRCVRRCDSLVKAVHSLSFLMSWLSARLSRSAFSNHASNAVILKGFSIVSYPQARTCASSP